MPKIKRFIIKKTLLSQMKKLLLSLITLLFVTSISFAQETDPAKILKNAKKALSSYSLDPAGNVAKLTEARTNIDLALKSDVNNTYEAWLTSGNIYAEIAGKDEIMRTIKKDAVATVPDAPLKAYTSFKNALDKAVKKYEKSDAIKGIADNQNRLQNCGADAYKNKDYATAYGAFNSLTAANEILKTAGEKKLLDEKQVNTFVYYAAISAQTGGMAKEAESSYKALIGKGSEDEAACYSALYSMLSAQKRDDEAAKYLDEGVKKYPNATDLLFAQINSYLRAGKMNELTDKLKLAIEKEPGNVNLYATLGSVYDNLSQIEAKAGNTAKSKENFDLAMKTYNDALVKDPKNFDSNYSLGALYYNKGAGYTEQLNKLNDDYSDAGTKKYEALKAEMNGIFAEALPFFKKAESINPNDKNTLVALKEILIRLNKMDESAAIKERMLNVDNGKKNADSYYKN